MAIAFDAIGSAPYSGIAAPSWSHTAASGSVIWIHIRNDAGIVPSSVTWAGSYNFTLAQSSSISGVDSYSQWYIDNIGNIGGPPSGTQTIQVNGPVSGSGESESYSGFSGHRIGLDGHSTNAAPVGTLIITTSITVVNSACWYVVSTADRSGVSPNPSSGWTSRVTAGAGASTASGDSNGISSTGSVSVGANVNGACEIMAYAFYIGISSVNTGNMFSMFH